MKLSKNNIHFVKLIEFEGIPYCWYVAMKSGRICDSREYINCVDGRTVVKEYSLDRLPASVRAFVNGSQKEVWMDCKEDAGYCEYIYR